MWIQSSKEISSSSTYKINSWSQTFPCPDCEYKARQKGSLQRHIESVHEGKIFPCNQCEYKATQKGHLQKHIKSVHEGLTFSCAHCDYKATHKSRFRKHK